MPLSVLAVMVHTLLCYFAWQYAFTALTVAEIKAFWFDPRVAGLSLFVLFVANTGLLLVYVVLDVYSRRPLPAPTLPLVQYGAAFLLLLALLAYHWALAGVRQMR